MTGKNFTRQRRKIVIIRNFLNRKGKLKKKKGNREVSSHEIELIDADALNDNECAVVDAVLEADRTHSGSRFDGQQKKGEYAEKEKFKCSRLDADTALYFDQTVFVSSFVNLKYLIRFRFFRFAFLPSALSPASHM